MLYTLSVGLAPGKNHIMSGVHFIPEPLSAFLRDGTSNFAVFRSSWLFCLTILGVQHLVDERSNPVSVAASKHLRLRLCCPV